MSGTRYAQFCALARAAEIIGERWTLLIVRELLLGPARFGDLAARLDGVSPALLTGRLNALIEHGGLAAADATRFRRLARVLGAIYHYDYFDRLEALRND